MWTHRLTSLVRHRDPHCIAKFLRPCQLLLRNHSHPRLRSATSATRSSKWPLKGHLPHYPSFPADPIRILTSNTPLWSGQCSVFADPESVYPLVLVDPHVAQFRRRTRMLSLICQGCATPFFPLTPPRLRLSPNFFSNACSSRTAISNLKSPPPLVIDLLWTPAS